MFVFTSSPRDDPGRRGAVPVTTNLPRFTASHRPLSGGRDGGRDLPRSGDLPPLRVSPPSGCRGRLGHAALAGWSRSGTIDAAVPLGRCGLADGASWSRETRAPESRLPRRVEPSRASGFDVLDAGGFESAADTRSASSSSGGPSTGWGRLRPRHRSSARSCSNELLDRHADGGPVLLRLDDLQWADRESVEALIWMLQRASGDRLLVGIASRPLPTTMHPAWQRWSSGRGRVLPVPLTGLTLENATRLLRDVRPDLNRGDGPTALGAHRREPVVPRRAAGRVRRRRPREPTVAAGTAGLRRGHRLAEPALSGDALALVRAVAVLGADWCSLADAGSLASVEHPTDAAHELVEQGLLRKRDPDAGAAVRVAQPILHSAIYEQIPPAERRALHGTAAGIVPRTEDVLGHRIAAVERYDDTLAMEIDAWASYLHEVSLHRLAARHLRAAAWLSSDPRDRERRWLDSLFESLLAQDTGVVRAVSDKVEDAEDVVRRDLVLGALATFEDDNHEAVYWFGKQLSMTATGRRSTPSPTTGSRCCWRGPGSRAAPTPGWSPPGWRGGRALPARDPALLGWHVAAGGWWRSAPVRSATCSASWPTCRRTRPPSPGTRATARAGAAICAPTPGLIGAGDRRPRARRLDGRRGWARGRTPAPARAPGPVPLVRRAVEQGPSAPAAGARPRRERVTGRGRDRAAARHRTGELEEADRKLAQPASCSRPTRGWRRVTVSTSRWSRGSTPTRARTAPAARSTTPCARPCARARSGELVKSAPWLAHAALAALWAEEQDDVDECLRLLTTSCDPGAPWVPSIAGWLRGLAAEAAGDQRDGPRGDRARGPGPGQRPPALSRAHAARPGPVGSRPRRPRSGTASA